MLQSFIHYGIHFVVPLIVALLCFKKRWLFAFLIMASAILIDLDHLLATPVFDSNRCSINYHPLHSYYAIGIYMLMLFIKKVRILGIGCLIHMLADTVDCLMM